MAEWWEDLYTGVTDFFSSDDTTDDATGGTTGTSFWDSVVDFADDFDLNSPAVEALQKYFREDPSDPTSDFSTGKIGSGLAGIAQVAGLLGLIDTDGKQPTGYQGEIPKYTAVRSRVADTYDPTRRPGSGGQRYFSDLQYVAPENVGAAQESAIQQAATLRQSNIDNPAQQRTPVAMMRGGIARLPNSMAQGGIASMQPKGYYLGGATDGMADAVPAQIDNQQPAALSDGEFVIPADVVSHLGNGNSNAGAQQLYSMMDNIRQARTGNKQQGKQINPNKFMPA